jgi:hypothetical protein
MLKSLRRRPTMEKIKDKNLVTESILKITWVYKDFLPPLGRPLGSV